LFFADLENSYAKIIVYVDDQMNIYEFKYKYAQEAIHRKTLIYTNPSVQSMNMIVMNPRLDLSLNYLAKREVSGNFCDKDSCLICPSDWANTACLICKQGYVMVNNICKPKQVAFKPSQTVLRKSNQMKARRRNN